MNEPDQQKKTEQGRAEEGTIYRDIITPKKMGEPL
jgi:hypothetical protein